MAENAPSGSAPAQGPGSSPYYPDGRGRFNDFTHPAPVQSTWPASLVSNAGHLSVDRQALRQVASAMRQDIAEIKAVVADLQANGLVTDLDVGSWDAPSGLATATCNAFAGITAFVTDLINAHEAVSDRITKSAKQYEDTEANNTSLSSGTAV
jgi:uncharacterized protein YukE